MFDEWIGEPLTHLFMQRAFWSCFLLSCAAPPLGVFMMLKRMSLVGDALSHGLLPGVALGFLYIGSSPWILGLSGIFVGFVLFSLSRWINRQTPMDKDAGFAASYLLSTALGVLLLSQGQAGIDLWDILFGSLMTISRETYQMIFVCAIGVTAAWVYLFPALRSLSFDPLFFQTLGAPVFAMERCFLVLVSCMLVVTFQAVGTLMAMGLFLFPGMIMRLWSNRLLWICVGSIFLGWIGSFFGLGIAYHCAWPPGPSMILVWSVMYGVSLICFKGRQWLMLMGFMTLHALSLSHEIQANSQDLKPLPISVKCKLVTSTTLLKHLVEKLLGSQTDFSIQAVMLGHSLHEKHINPIGLKTLAESDCVLIHGASWDGWMAAFSQERKIPLISFNQGESQEDPHVWHDVNQMRSMVCFFKERLSLLFPDRAIVIQQNAQAYDEELKILDQEIRSLLQTVPNQSRFLITNHKAFSHFGHAYGFTCLAYDDVHHHGEQDPKAMANLIQVIQKHRIKVFFREAGHSDRKLRILSEQAGWHSQDVTILQEGLFAECLPENLSYCEAMRWNAQLIAQALTSETQAKNLD